MEWRQPLMDGAPFVDNFDSSPRSAPQLKELRTPMLPLGTERGLAFKMDPLTSPFV
jgi:hypothetical protein